MFSVTQEHIHGVGLLSFLPVSYFSWDDLKEWVRFRLFNHLSIRENVGAAFSEF